MSFTYVCGHKNPDTDSCCAAIAYAHFLKLLTPNKTIIPIMAGPASPQTKFVLQKFKASEPMVCSDITPKALHLPVLGDLDDITLKENEPLARAFETYTKRNEHRHISNQCLQKSGEFLANNVEGAYVGLADFPVVDDSGVYKGTLQIIDLIPIFMRPYSQTDLTMVEASASSITITVKGQIVSQKTSNLDVHSIQNLKICVPTMTFDVFRCITADWNDQKWNQIYIIDYNPDIVSEVCKHNKGIIIVSKQNEESSKKAIRQSASRLSIGGLSFDEALQQNVMRVESSLDLAQMVNESSVFTQLEDADPLQVLLEQNPTSGTIVITTHLSVAAVTMLIKQASPIKMFIRKDKLFRVKSNMLIRDVRERFNSHSNLHGLSVINEKNELTNFIYRPDVQKVDIIDLVLVDHNEVSQQVNGSHAIGVNLIEIVDHHKVQVDGTMQISKITVKPWGCTCTIITEMYRQRKKEIPLQIAGLMISAIMTDTQVLKSPTTTQQDRETVQYLESILSSMNIKHQVLGNEIFGAVSGFGSGDMEKVIRTDYKTFEAKMGTYGVSQIEIGNLDVLTEEIILKIRDVMASIKKNENLFMVCVLITEVPNQFSLLFANAPSAFSDIVGYKTWTQPDVFELPGVVSRKKQLIPHLQNVLPMLSQ